MTELTACDRLQPSLLDRLTDFEPDARHEPRERRVLSQRALRDSVQRDIGWLLNASGLDAVQDVAGYPHVATSVLNYGLPDLAGRHVAGLTKAALERRIREALWAFEPRLMRDTVRVTALEDTRAPVTSMCCASRSKPICGPSRIPSVCICVPNWISKLARCGFSTPLPPCLRLSQRLR